MLKEEDCVVSTLGSENWASLTNGLRQVPWARMTAKSASLMKIWCSSTGSRVINSLSFSATLYLPSSLCLLLTQGPSPYPALPRPPASQEINPRTKKSETNGQSSQSLYVCLLSWVQPRKSWLAYVLSSAINRFIYTETEQFSNSLGLLCRL